MSQAHPHLGAFALMPATPGTCPECATKHTPEEPHNQQSLAYQYDFYGKNGRWPTWSDAMAHCDDKMRQLWTEQLLKRGVRI